MNCFCLLLILAVTFVAGVFLPPVKLRSVNAADKQGFATVPSFPESLYPEELSRKEFQNNCPIRSSKVEFCASRFKDCFGHNRSVGYCNSHFCDCVKVSAEKQCTQYSDRACAAVYGHGNGFRKQIIEKKEELALDAIKKRLKPIIGPYNKMIKDCGVEAEIKIEVENMMGKLNITSPILDLTLPFFAMIKLESSISKSAECVESIEAFKSALERVDSKASENLHHPYHLWYIGVEFGPIGKVITRIGIDEMCGKSSFEFNQGSAAHLDCYGRKTDKEECDEKYIDHITNVLGTLDAKKVDCRMMVELMKSIQTIRGDDFYREAREFHGDASTTSIRGKFNVGIDNFENGSLTRRETKITFLDLEASQKSTLKIKDHFESVTAKCGGSKKSADTVASCGLRYEYCIHFNEEECQKLLSTCLNPIDEKNEECQNAIIQISDVLWPNTTPTRNANKDDNSERYILCIVAVLGVIFFAGIAYMFVRNWKGVRERICGRKPTDRHEETELMTVRVDELQQEPEAARLLEELIDNTGEEIVDSNNSNVPVIQEEMTNNETPAVRSMKFDEVQTGETNNGDPTFTRIDLSQPTTSS